MRRGAKGNFILDHFNQFGSITSEEALRLYGIPRLAIKIYYLRRLGYSIETDVERTRGTHFAKYTLIKGE